MNKYQEILNKLVSNCEFRTWMKKPFIINDKVFATNISSMVVFDLSKVEILDNFNRYDESWLANIYPVIHNLDNTYSINYLKELFKLVPLIDDYDEDIEEVVCEDCDGSCEVTFIYADVNGNDHEIEDECPVCGGAGVCDEIIKKPNGKTIEDPYSKCMIGNSLFSISNIKYILEIAELLDVNEFKLVYQTTPDKQNVFKIGDVELLIMPVSKGYNFSPDEIIFKIYDKDLPIIGQTYNYFDEGKIKPSRKLDVVITNIIPFLEIDEINLYDWDQEVRECDWLYAKETDYFITGDLKISNDNTEEIIFVRTVNNNHEWFSLGLWSGRLDVDGSLNNSLNE